MPREIYFQIQVLVHNEEAGEPRVREDDIAEQHGVKEMFKEFM
jgi:hypothetical protein